MDEMDAIVKEFIAESRENLDRLDLDLIELEKNPRAKEQLASIFRAIHSIKGATGFLGFPKLGAVAHIGEGLLSRLRDGVLIIDSDITGALLTLGDHISRILANIEQTGSEGDVNCTALIERLTRLQDNNSAQPLTTASTDHRQGHASPASHGDARTSSSASDEAGSPGEVSPQPTGWETAGDGSTPINRAAASRSVRVDVRQLDKLMNLVGELVLTRNELLQFNTGQANAVPLGTSQRLNSITTELQDEIMRVRMQPIENVWNKFPRLVRDLALQSGKKARLEMRGKETELDRTLLEAITDPLTHLIRNAVDHGLEPANLRVASGKTPEGHILLRASHESGQVTIDICDDGAGIDLPRVKQKAIERGLVTPDRAKSMSDEETLELIFLPGLSTSENVTSISGRGVGMDIVKTNIEKIGGQVLLENHQGLGMTVKIKIPLTLAIIAGLVVAAGGDRYAIPQSSVVELVRLEGADVFQEIERIQNASVFRLRGDLLPLISLEAELTMTTPNLDLSPRVCDGKEVASIVVLQTGDRKFGLLVDEVIDTQEIVVKPLGTQLKGTAVFAGATILGDGAVILILDVLGLALKAHVISESQNENTIRNHNVTPPEAVSERRTLLLFAGPDGARMAVPLAQVTRLEEFPASLLERTWDQDVVQYRGGILPLVNISTLLPERRLQPRNSSPKAEKDPTVQAIVYSQGEYIIGLIVEEIIDTIDHSPMDLRPPSREGTQATSVIEGRVTEILDLAEICSGLGASIHRKRLAEEART